MNLEVLRDKFRGALLGLAVGDSLGAPFEGARRPLSRETVDEVERRSSQLAHTDDTAMAVALAESLLARRALDQDHVAHHFARTYAGEPWRGYGAGAAEVLTRVHGGDPWEQAATQLFDGAGSYGNGAAMRVAPVALFAYPDLEETDTLARRSAIVTHAHPLGVEGAAIQSLAVALALRHDARGPVDPGSWIATLRARCRQPGLVGALGRIHQLLARPQPSAVVEQLGNGIEALTSVPAALTAYLAHSRDFDETIRFAIRLGGDTDTIAAMAGAVAGAALGAAAIPAGWLERVEGQEHLTRLADELYERAPANMEP